MCARVNNWASVSCNRCVLVRAELKKAATKHKAKKRAAQHSEAGAAEEDVEGKEAGETRCGVVLHACDIV